MKNAFINRKNYLKKNILFTIVSVFFITFSLMFPIAESRGPPEGTPGGQTENIPGGPPQGTPGGNENTPGGPPEWLNPEGKSMAMGIASGQNSHVNIAGNASQNGYKISYEHRNNYSEETKFLGLNILGIIEFIDYNNNGIPDETEAISWHNITEENLSISGYETETFLITELSSGPLSIIFYVPTPEILQLSNMAPNVNTSSGARNLTAGEVKFDIIIENYNYTSNESRIAVMIELNNINMARYGYNRTFGERGFSFSEGVDNLYFSWVNNATVDDVDEDVYSNFTFDGEKILLTFAFSSGESIYYDPYFGISYTLVIDELLEEIFEKINENIGKIYGNIKVYFSSIILVSVVVYISKRTSKRFGY